MLLSKTVLHPCLKWQGALWSVMEGIGSAIPRWLISPPSAGPPPPLPGTLQQLLKDLDNTGDPLAVAAALVQLQELAATSQGPAALLLHQLLMPRLLPLATHQDTAAPALHLAAQLVAAASQALLLESAGGAGAAATSNGVGVSNGAACNGAAGGAHSSSDSDMEVDEAASSTSAGPWAELRGDNPHPLLQLLTHMVEEGRWVPSSTNCVVQLGVVLQVSDVGACRHPVLAWCLLSR